jgi:hypothetical protein
VRGAAAAGDVIGTNNEDKPMALIGVVLFAIYAFLFLVIVVLPVLALCGFGGLGWWALGIRNARLRVGVLGVCAVGMLAAVAWAIGNDAVEVIRMAGAWL